MARASHLQARRPSLPTLIGTLLVVGLAFFGLPGCGNDFDALFAKADAGTTTTESADGGAPADGATTPDNIGPASCGAPTACTTSPKCDDSDCEQTCDGCGCSCAPFNCNDGDAEKCTTTCALGTTCSTTCSAEKSCSLVSKGATAKLSCIGRADCGLTCNDGGTCDLECTGSSDCTLTCDAKSSCLVRCLGDPRSCNVDCQGGQRLNCPQAGVFTCNRDCPK